MSGDLRRMVLDNDEAGLERGFQELPQFFWVDWREDVVDIVAYCADALGLSAPEWRGEDLFLSLDGRDTRVPWLLDVDDHHVTVCTLNDLLAPRYEIRFVVCSHGNDAIGLVALSVAEWQELESENRPFVSENFIDPRTLPNVMTELTDDTLPPNAQARLFRMRTRPDRRVSD